MSNKEWSVKLLVNNQVSKSMCKVCEHDICYDKVEQVWYLVVEESCWDDYHDDFRYQKIPINFCPGCGKDYRAMKEK